MAMILLTGCGFSERSFSLQPQEVSTIEPVELSEVRTETQSTRSWLVRSHQQLKYLIDDKRPPALLTDDLTNDEGRPVDVYGHFERRKEAIRRLTGNWHGLKHTAQGASTAELIRESIAPWPGFEQVWIPVGDEIALSGWLGHPKQDFEGRANTCIVILPGFFGGNNVVRTRDLAETLTALGYSVLALELRGHGHTDLRYPDVYYTFGLWDTYDLLLVSDWLIDRQPQITRTGLIGFCWGANHAMLAACYDGLPEKERPFRNVRRGQRWPKAGRVRYQAGIMAFSPVLRWEEIMDLTDRPQSKWLHPCAYYFQETIKRRMVNKQHPECSGNLRRLINYELLSSHLSPSLRIDEAYSVLRFLPYRNQPDGDRLELAQVPLLLVTAANDPFLNAQDMADLAARTENPNVAAMVLAGGGHVGFTAYNTRYFFSLVNAFFDSETGPG